MSVLQNTTGTEPLMAGAMDRLARRLADVGLNLTVHPASGEPFCAPARLEACKHLCGSDGPVRQAQASLVEQIWLDGQPRVVRSPAGCVVMGIPVMQRRRMVAVAVVCHLSADSADTEEFARLCDRLSIDRQYLAQAIQRGPAGPGDNGDNILKLVQWLISQELDQATAQAELATLSANLGSTYEELSLLYRISGEMRVSTPLPEFFQGICQDLLEVMNVGAVAVILDEPAGQTHCRVIRAGQLELDDDQIRSLAAKHLRPKLDATSHSHVANDLGGRIGKLGRAVRNAVAVGLSTGDRVTGLVIGINKSRGEFDSVDLKLIKSVANQAAVFLSNYSLYEELQELLMGVLHVLTASIDAKDPYTCGHSQRVALISQKLAQMCGFSEARVRTLYLSGLLHDIGKIGVPESVLCKAGKLTEAEFATMRRHPVIGAKIISNLRQMKDVLPGVLHHHERIDGRGYPDGLIGGQVPIEGLIVGLADCFDAMTSNRTYRRALPLEAVIAEIMRCSGTQFDPKLVDHLMQLDLEKFLTELRESDPAAADIGKMLRTPA